MRSTPRRGRPWEVDLEPAVFAGDRRAAVRRGKASEDQASGTTVTIPIEPNQTLRWRRALKEAARFYPLPVWLDGQKVYREPFCADADHIEQWEGVRFAVRRNSGPCRLQRLNFWGQIVCDHSLPAVIELPTGPRAWRGSRVEWTVDVDIVEAGHLQLTLPARQAVVENDCTTRLRAAARAAIHRALASAGVGRVRVRDRHEAAANGVRLPGAEPLLFRWRADPRDQHERRRRWACTIGLSDLRQIKDPLVFDAAAPAADQGALERTGRANRVFAPEPVLNGYDWYDALPRIRRVRTLVTRETDGTAVELEEVRRNGDPLPSERVAAIAFELDIGGQTGAGETTLRLDADMAITDPEPWEAAAAGVLLTRDAAIDAAELEQLLHDATYKSSDDVDADAHETQQAAWRSECRHEALRLVESETKAAAASLRAEADRLRELVPAGTTATIRLEAGQPAVVRLEAVAGDAAGSAAATSGAELAS